MFNNDDFNIKDFKEKVNNLSDDATIQDVLEILGMDNRQNDNRPFENEPPINKPNRESFDDAPINNDRKPNN